MLIIPDFKLRRLDDSCTVDENAAGDRAHFAHLYSLYTRKHGYSDLLEFFALDFFHDGLITDIKLHRSERRVTIELDSPYIERFSDEPRLGLVAIFRCVFSDVAVFAASVHPPEPEADPDIDGEEDIYRGEGWREFLYAEIDTLDEEIAFFNRQLPDHKEYVDGWTYPFHSLLIRLMGGTRLAIVFREVRVEARESLAWQIWRQSVTPDRLLSGCPGTDTEDRLRRLARIGQ